MTENIHIERAVERVALLDRIADYPDLDDLLSALANDISAVVASRHGTGSWSASHALRSLTDDDVALLLTAYGASTFTVQQHTETLRQLIRGGSFRGGVSPGSQGYDRPGDLASG